MTVPLVLFGARSPLVVDYEETAARLDRAVRIVSVGGTPRALGRARIVALADFAPARGVGYLACAFVPGRRAELAGVAEGLGLAPAEPVVDPTAVVARSARLGEGSFVNAGAVIGGCAMLGAHVVVNRAASLGHHCVLGDFASVGPGAHLPGNVRVGERALIGAGAVILPDTRIGDGAVVAAGALVRRDVPDGRVASGHPARLLPYDPRRGVLGRRDQE